MKQMKLPLYSKLWLHGYNLHRLNTAVFSAPDPKGCGGTWTDVCLTGDFSSSAQFFVALAALVFLYCVTALVVYIGYNRVYQQNNKFPLTVSNTEIF